MRRQASARWEGSLKDGKGVITSDSGALVKKEYSFGARHGSEIGLTPEELLAAAHAACFSMTLAGELSAAGIKPESIYTNAVVNFSKESAGFAVAGIHLEVQARIPGIEAIGFERAAHNAKQHSPLLALLKDRNKVLVTTHLSTL